MIKFFRRIRQRLLSESKFSKYLLYAIGEIVLVVIGILIALQINNWNEHRKSNLIEDNRLVILVEALRTDSASFIEYQQQIDIIQELHKQLYTIGVKNGSPDSLGDIHLIRRLLRFDPITKENDPLIATKISDEPVRQEILKYFSAINDLAVVYDQFYAVIHDRMRIYLGEQGLYQLKTQFEEQESGTDWISREGMITISKTQEFQQILFEANLKLAGLTRELKTVTEQNEILKQMVLDKLDDKIDMTQQ